MTYFAVFYAISSDIRILFRHSLTFHADTKDKMLANIMLSTHAIEKGMSFSRKKNGWGGSKAYTLCVQIETYLQKHPYNERISVAINVLNNYKIDNYGDKNPNILKFIDKLCYKYQDKIKNHIGGVKSVSKPTFPISYDNIMQFYLTRSSVRDFSDVALSKDEIEHVHRLAQTTPSACNRQSCHLYTFQNRNTMHELLASQLGDQGWCSRADTLFIVTANLSYFNATHERFEPYIDGGMFAMNVVMALHAQKIASCCKMFIQHPALEKKVKKIAGIPDGERPIMIILAGHYKDEAVQSPLSHRLLTPVTLK
jgi:nitroreductase